MGWRGVGDGDGTGAAAAAAGPGESEGEMNLWHWQSHSHRTGSGGRRSRDLIEDNDTVRHLKHSTVGYSFFRPRFFSLFPSLPPRTPRLVKFRGPLGGFCVALEKGPVKVWPNMFPNRTHSQSQTRRFGDM